MGVTPKMGDIIDEWTLNIIENDTGDYNIINNTKSELNDNSFAMATLLNPP